MSMTLSTSFPDGLAQIDGTAELRQLRLAQPSGAAKSARAADAPAMDAGPQVYCMRHGARHAARGLSPCSDLGCTGCGMKD